MMARQHNGRKPKCSFAFSCVSFVAEWLGPMTQMPVCVVYLLIASCMVCIVFSFVAEWLRPTTQVPVCIFTLALTTEASATLFKSMKILRSVRLNTPAFVISKMKWDLLYSAHIHPENSHGAGGIHVSKCIEAVPLPESPMSLTFGRVYWFEGGGGCVIGVLERSLPDYVNLTPASNFPFLP
jgi:hypothetical protein